VFGWRWVRSADEGAPVAAYLAALTGGLAGLFLLTRGLADLALHCDIITPAWLLLFAVAGGLTGLGVRLRPADWRLRAAVLAAAGAAGGALYLGTAPQCLAGPFGMLDPLVRRFWYMNVFEGRPFWEQPAALALPVVAQGLVMLGALAWLWRSSAGAAGRWWGEYWVVAAGTLVTGLLVWRSMAFVGALAAVPLGWLAVRLLMRLRRTAGTAGKLGAGLAVILLLMPGFPVMLVQAVIPDAAARMERVSDVAEASCDLSGQMAQMNRLPPAVFFAPLDIGPLLIERTRHTVVATGHHRADQAMHDVIAAFTGPADRALPLIRKYGADYVVMCNDLAEPRLFAREAPQGLAAELAAGRPPSWLEPVQFPGAHSQMIWRVTAPSAVDPHP
jgi:hypothetical protein